jgi:hypothetical protein
MDTRSHPSILYFVNKSDEKKTDKIGKKRDNILNQIAEDFGLILKKRLIMCRLRKMRQHRQASGKTGGKKSEAISIEVSR